MNAAHGHGVLQLALQFLGEQPDALRPTAVDCGDVWAGQQHAIGPQGQGLAHIHTSADAAVHQNGHLPLHRVGDGGQDLGGGGDAVLDAAAVVGDDDAGGAGLQGLPGPRSGHDAFDEEGELDILDDLPQLLHRLGAGGRCQPLEEGQAGGVDVHGEHLGPGGLGAVQLGVQGIPVPGLHRGDAPAPGGADGGSGGGEHIRVGAVASEGGNACIRTGGDQDVVVLHVVELVPIVEVHRAHRAGKDGELISLAKEREAGVHRFVLADGVHVEAERLPCLVVADGHGAGALGARTGHRAAAGPAIAYRAGFTVGTAAGAGGRQYVLIGHKNPSLYNSFVF